MTYLFPVFVNEILQLVLVVMILQLVLVVMDGFKAGHLGLLTFLFSCIGQNYSWCDVSGFVVQRILRIGYVDAIG